MARIAVGGFQHETNTFAPSLATYEEFAKGGGWPGLSRGCSPTTPSPRTSCWLPSASVMIQWRVSSLAGTAPSLRIVMV